MRPRLLQIPPLLKQHQPNLKISLTLPIPILRAPRHPQRPLRQPQRLLIPPPPILLPRLLQHLPPPLILIAPLPHTHPTPLLYYPYLLLLLLHRLLIIHPKSVPKLPCFLQRFFSNFEAFLLFYEIGGLFEIEFVEFFCHEGFECFEAFVDILKDEFE